jgi:AAA15 family ATPase/GTPase
VKLISEIEIDHFRSIKSDHITGLGDFTAFAGLNNSGKSNVLRALHAFFTNKTDANVPLNIDTDFYRHDLKRRKAKRIRIAIKFNLPSSFKFRKWLEDTQKFLGGTTFKITKEWRRDYASASYYLNDSDTPLDLDSREKVDQFLSLNKDISRHTTL